MYRVVLALDMLFRRCVILNCIFGAQIYIEICMLKILLHCYTIGGCCIGGSKSYLCAVSGVLVTYCVGYSCCSVERHVHWKSDYIHYQLVQENRPENHLAHNQHHP